MEKKFLTWIGMITLLIVGCATTGAKVDVQTFTIDKGQKETIPKICKAAYESFTPGVAVVNFTNNTTFDYAKEISTKVRGSSQRTTVGGAAAGVTPGGVGVVWAAQTRKKFEAESLTTQREMNAKLAESTEDGVMDEIVNLGGARVYTRKELSKVFDEQKLQQSGMVDDKTLVKLGKLVGVKYLITGSVNNVDIKYNDMQDTKDLSKHAGKKIGDQVGGWGGALISIAGHAAAAAQSMQEGWDVGTELTVRILEVETGEVLLSKKVVGRHLIGKIPYPNYDAMIGAIKKATTKSMEDLRPDMSKWFAVKGYILQTRTSPDGKARIARLNIGDKVGMKPGTKLTINTFEEIEDPLTEKKTCDVQVLPVDLIVSADQIQPDSCWATIEGASQGVARVKAGQLVVRKALEGQSFMKKMGH